MPTTLFARLVALLAVTLLATQIIGGVLFFLVTPPPGPPMVHVSEVADVLARTRATSDGSIAAPEPTRDQIRLTQLEPLLAARLGVAPADVRLWQDRLMGMPFGDFDRTRIDPVITSGYRAAVRTERGWVEVNDRLHEPFDLLRRMGTWLLISLACIGPVAVLLGARLTSPITAFAQAAERLGHDPHAPPMRQSGPAEVVLAINAFNEMQGRLRAYVDDRVRMVGAIAHDLRTPLTRLRLQVQVLPPAARGRAEAVIERMDRMVEGALSFVKDAGTARERTPLHFLSLVEAVAEDMESGGAIAEVEAGPDPIVLGDESGLRRVVANLFSNAMRYSGGVRCRVLVDAGCAVLQIDDHGPGVDEADLERVFDPYVRLDDGGEGIGLGLSIVRSIVRLHGGEATLENLASGGLRAQVRLPLADAAAMTRGAAAAVSSRPAPECSGAATNAT